MDITIGTLAKRAKVNLQTLRYYERCGLLAPARRAVSGYRLYNEESLRLLKFIRHAQAYEFSLKEIQSLLRLKLLSPADCRQARRKVEAKVVQIGKKIESMERMAKSLKRMAEECRRQGGRGSCPILSRLYGGGHENEKA